MNTKACCVTGHRDIPTDKREYVTAKLKQELEQAIADGYTAFISGMAAGVDLLFAELVIEQKALHPQLTLEAAIPYRNRLYAPDPQLVRCLAACDSIRVEAEQYTPDCMMNRNRYMVTMSARVIAVFDGRERGGTLFTMSYAHVMERELREIRI